MELRNLLSFNSLQKRDSCKLINDGDFSDHNYGVIVRKGLDAFGHIITRNGTSGGHRQGVNHPYFSCLCTTKPVLKNC